MKITTYYPNGSVKDVHEHTIDVPKYIRSYDPKHSFLNISEEDVDAVTYKKKDLEKHLILNRYRFLIGFDFDNYQRYIKDNYKKDIDVEQLKYLDYCFSLLLHFYGSRDYLSLRNEKEIHILLSSNALIETILFHALSIYNRLSNRNDKHEMSLFTCLSGLIHRVYYALKKANVVGLLSKDEQAIMYVLYPFANLSTFIGHNLLCNDTLLVKMIKALYLTNEECRDTIYAFAQMLNQSSTIGVVPNTQKGLVMMMTGSSGNSNNEKIIFDARPSNGIEMTQIAMSEEEIACLVCYDMVGKPRFVEIENIFKNEYTSYYNLNAEILKKIINRTAIRKFRTEPIVSSQWETFYYDTLDDLECQYKNHYRSHKELMSPFCYYYLLVNMCDPGHKYEFNGDFLVELVNYAIDNKCTNRCELYYQIIQLNYMQESAYMIAVENNEDNKTPDEVSILRDKLLSGKDGTIAKELLLNNNKFESYEDAIEKILVFLTPLYCEKYMVNPNQDGIDDFQKRLKILLQDNSFLENLKPKELMTNKKNERQLGFNVKLVMNIIGVLSKENDVKFVNPLKKRIADPLCRELEELWQLKRAKGYNSYVNKFDNNRDLKEFQTTKSFSLLNEWMIDRVKQVFSN